MEICRKRRGVGDVETGWEKKNYDDPSSDSFSVLTTLKNRWTLFLNRRDSDYNPHVWFFFGFPFTFICFLPVSSRQWYAAPITEEKMSHHGQFSYDLYICICIYTLLNALDQKYFSYSFSFSLSVTSWYTGKMG